MVYAKGLVYNTTPQIHFPSCASHFSLSSFFFFFFPSFLPLLPSLHFLPSLFGHIWAITKQVTTKTTRSLCASQSIQARPESNQESPSKFSGITQEAAKLVNGVWVYVATSIIIRCRESWRCSVCGKTSKKGLWGKARRYLCRMRVYRD